MTETTTARPGQVTVAGWVVVVASVVVVGTVFDQLGHLNTVEARDGVRSFLSEPPGNGLGLTVDTALRLLRACAMAAAALATAAAILGVFVLRRDRVARRALTIVAVPLFLTGLASGGFLPAVIAGSSLMLWAQPARDWFDGRRTTPPAQRGSTSSRAAGDPFGSAPPGLPTGTPTSTPTSTLPSTPTSTPVSAPVGVAPGRPDTAATPQAWTGWGAPQQAGSDPTGGPRSLLRRPVAVRWACLTTWVFSAITVLGLVVSALMLLRDGDDVVAEARADRPELVSVDISDSTLLAGIVVVLAGLAVWAVLAMVLALLVWQGRDWARITLVVSAIAAAVLALLSLLSSLFALPLVIGCVAVTRLLLGRAAAAWCRTAPTPPPGQLRL